MAGFTSNTPVRARFEHENCAYLAQNTINEVISKRSYRNALKLDNNSQSAASLVELSLNTKGHGA